MGTVRWRVEPSRLSATEKKAMETFGDFKQRPPNVSDHFGIEAVIEIRER
jgi:hypothetical protein